MKAENAITPRKYDRQLSRTKMCLLGSDVVNVTSHCTTMVRELMQQDGWEDSGRQNAGKCGKRLCIHNRT